VSTGDRDIKRSNQQHRAIIQQPTMSRDYVGSLFDACEENPSLSGNLLRNEEERMFAFASLPRGGRHGGGTRVRNSHDPFRETKSMC